jgi:hypothetical protein
MVTNKMTRIGVSHHHQWLQKRESDDVLMADVEVIAPT